MQDIVPVSACRLTIGYWHKILFTVWNQIIHGISFNLAPSILHQLEMPSTIAS